jgi:hypothetical protein
VLSDCGGSPTCMLIAEELPCTLAPTKRIVALTTASLGLEAVTTNVPSGFCECKQ